MRDMEASDTARKLDLPHGAYSQIARRLRPHVSPQHVREVYLGRRSSPRVERAIETYIARWQREQDRKARRKQAAPAA